MRVKQLCLVALGLLIPCITRAQQASSGKIAVISIQPLYAMLTVYAGEAELAMSRSATVGLGATYVGNLIDDGFDYLSSDVKLRFYPEGRPFQGFSFGGSVGITHVSTSDNANGGSASASGPSIGVMLDYNWLLGEQKSFFISTGLGAKTLFISDKTISETATLHYPTMRISVGWAF
jgi:hypothetical protein